MADVMTGGCLCGAVRYEVSVEGDDAYFCHCRMCQKATGGVAAPFVAVVENAVRWLTEPTWYASSPIAKRPFCPKCGTPLGFAFVEGEGMDLTVGSFDDPSRFRPVRHAGAESLHEAWLNTSALPRKTSAETESVSERWRKAGGRLPD